MVTVMKKRVSKVMKAVLKEIQGGKDPYASASNIGGRTNTLMALRGQGLLDLRKNGAFAITSAGKRYEC